jgi:hypothetical protein
VSGKNVLEEHSLFQNCHIIGLDTGSLVFIVFGISLENDKNLFSEHFYLGSANVGSRGTTFTKELGVLVTNCPQLGADARKIFDLYWSVYKLKVLPER